MPHSVANIGQPNISLDESDSGNTASAGRTNANAAHNALEHAVRKAKTTILHRGRIGHADGQIILHQLVKLNVTFGLSLIYCGSLPDHWRDLWHRHGCCKWKAIP